MDFKEVISMRRMNEMSYFIGVKVRIYPSNEQKRMIAKNDSAARFIYNRLVSRNKELYQLSRVNLYCRPVADRIDYLNSLGLNLTDFKALYLFLEDKDIDSLAIMNAKQNYMTAWNNFRKNKSSGVPVFHKKGYVSLTRLTHSIIKLLSVFLMVTYIC